MRTTAQTWGLILAGGEGLLREQPKQFCKILDQDTLLGQTRRRFSDDVLSTVPANLAVLPVHGLPWSDWGRPERVLKTLAELGVEPAWAAKRAAVGGSS